MLSEKEEKFMQYWEQNRLNEKKLSRQLYIGLPIGILFAAGILGSVMGGGWYTRAFMVMNAQVNPLIFIIALIAIVFFVAVFYKKFKWEQHEQQYLELAAKKRKAAKTEAAE
jgi:hypothetical protein